MKSARARRTAGATGAEAAGGAVVRAIGVRPERSAAPAARPAERFVAVDRLRERLDQVNWPPLRLAGSDGRRGPAPSPRLPHALVLHLAHAARGASAPEVPLDAVPVRPDVPALASFLGVDAPVVAGALDALCEGALLEAGPGAAADAVTLAPALLAPAPRGAALDWARVALATAGSPSAWLAAHVLAERLAPGEWTPVPRSALEHALGCGVSGVRGAVDRLAAAGVVERREQRGGVSAYRFATTPAVPPAALPSAVPSPALASPLVPPPAVPAGSPATGVRLTIGGVDLDVPAGLSVRIELGPDGRPRIALASQA